MLLLEADHRARQAYQIPGRPAGVSLPMAASSGIAERDFGVR
jgi:hypothetical protein